ncbi:MAG: glucosaminidase domain-containing protein, partial [Desulfobulbaceae bacterium]|nr:glucosaminidase domain-containing protein [Desulfobulbaceae bacterium]
EPSLQMVQKNNGPESKEYSSSGRPHLLTSHQGQEEIKPPAGLVNTLAKTEFSNLYEKQEYAGLVAQKFPKYLVHLDVPNKKDTFFRTLLPSIIIALKEVETERSRLLALVQKISFQPMMTLSEKQTYWQNTLDNDEIEFLLNTAKKYRSNEVSELLRKVKGYPVSLILAQGAIESSWGTSRFVVQGNNVFGVWTWGERGIVPSARDEGKTHKVAVYDSILDSVRGYILNLNRHYAYNDLRKYRETTSDSLVLAEGLWAYSERRKEYVNDVKDVIEANNLQYFDTVNLTISSENQTPFPASSNQVADIMTEKTSSLPSS